MTEEMTKKKAKVFNQSSKHGNNFYFTILFFFQLNLKLTHISRIKIYIQEKNFISKRIHGLHFLYVIPHSPHQIV